MTGIIDLCAHILSSEERTVNFCSRPRQFRFLATARIIAGLVDLGSFTVRSFGGWLLIDFGAHPLHPRAIVFLELMRQHGFKTGDSWANEGYAYGLAYEITIPEPEDL